MQDNFVALEDMAGTLSRFGNKGKGELQILGELVKYLDKVVNSEVGKAIIMDDANRWAELMHKYQLTDLDIDEKAELRYLKRRLDRIANKLHEFQTLQGRVIEKIEAKKQAPVSGVGR